MAEKGEDSLIKNNVLRYVDSISLDMETLVAFMERTIPQEHTLFGAKLKFAIIIRTKMRPAGTPEHLKKGIVRSFT